MAYDDKDCNYAWHWSKSERISAAIGVITIIGLAIFVAWAAIIGRFDRKSDTCRQTEEGYSVCEIKTGDGRTVTCIKPNSGLVGGSTMTCDWDADAPSQ